MPFESSAAVAEFQGLYGPYCCSERVLQKIWLKGEYVHDRLATHEGNRLSVFLPGQWNLLGGPDFRGAEIELDGRKLVGDVEVHFHARDWNAHGHGLNPDFASVVLHVVLFPPAPGAARQQRLDGAPIATLVLLPLLLRDLEEYASDDAIESLTGRDELRQLAELAALARDERISVLRQGARNRWLQKVRYARLRVDKVGWAAAAHQTALEVLGYARNRVPMLRLGTEQPLAAWLRGVDPERLYAQLSGSWNLHGLRPANHPLRRLKQYDQWIRSRPDWTDKLTAWGASLPRDLESANPSASVRRRWLFPAIREAASDLTGWTVGGSRLDNLVCDGFLPLLAAREPESDLAGIWHHWYPADAPRAVIPGLRRLGIAGSGGTLLCQGYTQGLLDWMLRLRST